ncbi:uracil-DNA glycosylase superfamily [Candidatus Moduliflexus flocculans]|uniref:Uracil-DNA glycosylase superfamily n=1 Tax=Candidatus Moduliflexus flocculans TaxID=1499966 RepID=A0A081BPB0_9BACT|nr:uracil-DNA glycosylase superfamily [Candidatus Moduliflexus flocculans]
MNRPTREELAAAVGRTVADVIAPNLNVLFCGINPSLYSAAVGHHFARPGNRFWKVICAAGFTPRLLSPHEEQALLACGCGITNFVERATAQAAEIKNDEFEAGAARLLAKALQYRPKIIAVLGLEAYRRAFHRPHAECGRQIERLGEALLWALPNPSGLNAHYQYHALVELFSELRRFSQST